MSEPDAGTTEDDDMATSDFFLDPAWANSWSRWHVARWAWDERLAIICGSPSCPRDIYLHTEALSADEPTAVEYVAARKAYFAETDAARARWLHARGRK